MNYIKCKNFTHCAGAKVYLENGGLLDIDGDYISANNGNDAALIMEGENAMGVVKAGAIYYNGSTSTDAYFAKTPEDGQTLGVDCRSWNYIKTYNNWNNTMIFSGRMIYAPCIPFIFYTKLTFWITTLSGISCRCNCLRILFWF